MNPRHKFNPTKMNTSRLDKALSKYLTLFMKNQASQEEPPADSVLIARCQKLIAEYRRRYGRVK